MAFFFIFIFIFFYLYLSGMWVRVQAVLISFVPTKNNKQGDTNCISKPLRVVQIEFAPLLKAC